MKRKKGKYSKKKGNNRAYVKESFDPELEKQRKPEIDDSAKMIDSQRYWNNARK